MSCNSWGRKKSNTTEQLNGTELMDTLSLTKEAIIYNGEKTISLTSGAGKLLEANIGKTLSDINHSRILYDPPPRLMEIKAKINK